ncbi:MAG: hypothetical protein BWY67_01293 [Bacteroidetes bacterium ADurb.Bin397]|nr:MAG: hypothetical protein BWY67_01293 [Bacteroidetes bacterium ADurb.Bin397]
MVTLNIPLEGFGETLTKKVLAKLNLTSISLLERISDPLF